MPKTIQRLKYVYSQSEEISAEYRMYKDHDEITTKSGFNSVNNPIVVGHPEAGRPTTEEVNLSPQHGNPSIFLI